MSTKTKRNFYLALIAIFVAIILVSVYYLLGGFKEVVVYQLAPTSRTVVGKYFEDPGSKEAVEHRKVCRDLVENEEIAGVLTEVMYLSDSDKDEEEGRFVGIALDQDIAEIPQDFDVREYESDVRFAVFLSMHFLVQPRPHKIEEMLREKARLEGYELENFFFTLVYGDRSRSVEGWVK